jgi:hypothetical protein
MNFKMIFTYLEKFTLGIWGLTFIIRLYQQVLT